MYDHARAVRRNKPIQPVHVKLKELIRKGFTFKAVKVFETADEYKAICVENEKIKHYGKTMLFNAFAGGGGSHPAHRCVLWNTSEQDWINLSNKEIAKKFNISCQSVKTFRHRNRKPYAPKRPMTDEMKELIRAKLKGRRLPETTRKKMSKSRTGQKHWHASSWIMINPNGHRRRTECLSRFCRNHCLDYRKFLVGRRHRNWSAIRIIQPVNTLPYHKISQ